MVRIEEKRNACRILVITLSPMGNTCSASHYEISLYELSRGTQLFVRKATDCVLVITFMFHFSLQLLCETESELLYD
jgi:hypothetical protein